MATEKLGQERNLKGHVEWEEHTHLYSPRCEWFRLGQLDWSHWKPRADLVVAHSSIPCQHGDAKPFPAIHPQLRTMHRSHETLVSSSCKRRKRVTRSPVLPREKGPGWCRRRLVAMRYSAGRRVAGLQPVPQWRLRGYSQDPGSDPSAGRRASRCSSPRSCTSCNKCSACSGIRNQHPL